MKKLLLTALAAFAFAGLHAQNEVEVNVLPITSENTSKFTVNFLEDFYVGSIAPIDSPKDMGLKAFKSWDLGFDIAKVHFVPEERHDIKLGVNFGTRFFKTRHKNIISNLGGHYYAAPFPAEAYSNSKRKSRLDVYELGLSLGYEYQVLDDLELGFDVIGNYNFSAKSVSKYKVGSSKEKVKQKHWKTQKFTPEYRLTIGLPDIKLYVRCAPHKLFKKAYGPELSYIAVGVIL